MIFLIHYDPRRGEVLSIKEFEDRQVESAESERLALEIAELGSMQCNEVIVLQAADKAALLTTHSRYFKTIEQIQSLSRR